jgi:DNA-binding winged helix-turn-helix (wHTH) protein/Tol biopolymer transport system component
MQEAHPSPSEASGNRQPESLENSQSFLKAASAMQSKEFYEFGPYRLYPAAGVLFRDGAIVELTPKVLDTLKVLVENAGQPVSKEELLRSVWPDTFVEESNLAQNISVLRKALGTARGSEAYIETIAKRGYRFVMEVRLVPAVQAPSASRPTPRPAKARRGPWLVVGAAVVVSATALGFMLTRPKAENPVAARFEVSLPAGTQAPVANLATQWVPSPDGRYLAMVYAENENNAIWLRPIGSLSSRRLDKTDGASFPFWSPDSRYIGFFADSKLKKLELASGVVQPVCDLLPDSSSAKPAGNGATWNGEDLIVYSPDLDWPLYRVAAAGGKPLQVTRLDRAAGERSHGWPQFLPDGRHVMYHSQNADFQKDGVYVEELGAAQRSLVMYSQTRAQWAEPGYLLFIRGSSLFAQRMDPRTYRLTGEPATIEEDVVSNVTRGRSTVSASPTGTLVYRSGGNLEGDLAWYDRAGKRTAAVGKKDLYRAVRLSPDGRKAAVVKGRADDSDLWIMDLATGALTRGTSVGKVHSYIGPWSPDSRMVLANQEAGRKGVLEVETSAGNVRELSQDAMWTWDWTPDGSSLLVTSLNRLEFATLPASGKPPLQVVSKTPFARCSFRLSPDGKWVAYESLENSQQQIEVASFPSFAEKRQISVDGGRVPEWRADGRELFFVHNRRLMSVDIRLGAKIESGVPKELFQFSSAPPYFSYSPVADGSRFLFLDLDDRAFTTNSLVVVLNWTAELKK